LEWCNSWRSKALGGSETPNTNFARIIPEGPSSGFVAFCSSFDYVCRVFRFFQPKDTHSNNRDFLEWSKDRGLNFQSNYGYAEPTTQTGYKDFSYYFRKQPIIPDELAFGMAVSWAERHFSPAMIGSKVLDWSSCISHCDRSTSAGWPWNMWYKTKGSMIDHLGPLLLLLLENFWDLCSDFSTAVLSFWMVSQKYEIRKLKKLNQDVPEIRTFVVSPIEHVISMNRICLDMNMKFYRAGSQERIFSFVGRSKFRGGFNTLMVRLGKFRMGFSLDGKKFDRSLFQRLLLSVMEMRWTFISPQFKTSKLYDVFKTLYYMVIWSMLVLEKGEIVFKETGNPSGFTNTIVDNTISMLILLFYCWIVLVKEHFRDDIHRRSNQVRRLKDFDTDLLSVNDEILDDSLDKNFGESGFYSNVEPTVNGDDSAFTASDSVLSWFNAKNINRVLFDLGVEVTGEEDSVIYYDIEYLSQKVVRYKGMFLPYPDENKVLSSLYLGSQNYDPRWTLLRAFALRIDSWANFSLSLKIMDFIGYMYNKYENSLTGTLLIPGSQDHEVQWLDIVKSHLTDFELEKLYCGFESRDLNVRCARKKIIDKIKFLDLFVPFLSPIDLLDC